MSGDPSGVYEVHPEVCLWALNEQMPMESNKKDPDGQRERWEQLGKVMDLPDAPPPMPWPKKCCTLDDYIDALVSAWTAIRILNGKAERIPEAADVDPRGLRMEMWFPRP